MGQGEVIKCTFPKILRVQIGSIENEVIDEGGKAAWGADICKEAGSHKTETLLGVYRAQFLPLTLPSSSAAMNRGLEC